jgi:transposase
MVFPQFLGVFSKVTTLSALALLDKYASPEAFMAADKQEIVDLIRKTARFGLKYAETKYAAIMEAAKAAQVFGHSVSSNFTLIRLYISYIRKYGEDIDAVLTAMTELAKANEGERFVKQIRLLQTIKGAGFLTAVTIMCETGDFSVFKSPKQFFAYFGLDPSVKQSGNFNGTMNKMSKRGSALARRVIHTIALVSIGRSKKGVPHNQVLFDYYRLKCQSKPKMVALGAVMHKVCNIIFAVLRDEKAFAIISPEAHNENYQRSVTIS